MTWRCYEQLFEEKLNLFVELLKGEPVTWSGRLRAAARRIRRSTRRPRTGTLRTWVAVGGSPESVVRAAYYGLPLMLAIIGGSPQRFAPWAELYRERLAAIRQAAAADRRALTGSRRGDGRAGERGAVAALRGADEPHRARARLAAERHAGVRAGGRPGRRAVCRLAGDRGGEDRRRRCKALGLSRFDLKYSNGTLPHDAMMRSIELYGTKVVPMVRERLGE